MKRFNILTTKQKEKLAEIASQWWTNKISGDFHHDNGDKSQSGQFAMFLADLGTKQLTQEQIDSFKKDLKDVIMNAFEEYSNWWEINLGTDYAPGYLLKDCAEKNNISTLNFPFKTDLWITPTSIIVRDGYGRDHVELFATKEYYEEKIESAQNFIKDCEKYKKDKNSWRTPEEWDESIVESKQNILNWQKNIEENKYDTF